MDDLRKRLYKDKEEATKKLKDFLVEHRKKVGFKDRRKITNSINRTLQNFSENTLYFDISEIERAEPITDEMTGRRKEVYDAYFNALNLDENETREYEELVKLVSVDVNSIVEEEELKLKREREEKWAREERIETEYKKSIEDTMKIFPEYVLQITPTEYVETKGENLEDYDFRTIDSIDKWGTEIYHKNHKFVNYDGSITRAKRDLVKKGENLEARVIVNLKSTIGNSWVHLIGTAMIPKKEK